MTQRKLPTRVNDDAAARSSACTEWRLGAKALGGGIGGAGSILQKLTIETGWSSVKPENLRRGVSSSLRSDLDALKLAPTTFRQCPRPSTSCAWFRLACDLWAGRRGGTDIWRRAARQCPRLGR